MFFFALIPHLCLLLCQDLYILVDQLQKCKSNPPATRLQKVSEKSLFRSRTKNSDKHNTTFHWISFPSDLPCATILVLQVVSWLWNSVQKAENLRFLLKTSVGLAKLAYCEGGGDLKETVVRYQCNINWNSCSYNIYIGLLFF